jgi:hypothetical protein
VGVERAQVADHRGGGQLLLQGGGVGAGARGIAGPGLEAAFEQLHLGGEIVVAQRVEGEAGLLVTGLPRADGALAVGGPDVDRPVLRDTPPIRAHAQH